MHEHSLGPSHGSTVVLDIGADTGALVVHTGPEDVGREIDINPTDGPAVRTHSAVRARHLPGGIYHAAVYPGLRAGVYAVWYDAQAPIQVTITGGAVSEIDIRADGAGSGRTAG